MNASNAHLYLPLVQAIMEGKIIQECYDGVWEDLPDANFTFDPGHYRIKPKEPRRWWILREGTGSKRDILWRHENPPRMPGDEVIEVIEVIK